MKTRKIWTVIWTHYNNECAIGMNDCSERMDHFSKEADARDFARFRTCHSEAAEPFSQDVPARIADRWNIH